MRWKVFGIIIVLAAACVVLTILFLDSFVKSKIESVGTSIVGAKVSLGGLNISLRKQSVAIANLEVADPENPWKNMFELKSASFDFSLPDILMGHVLIESISADSPAWGTKRKTFGGIEKKPSEPKEKPEIAEKPGPAIDWQQYLPSTELPKDFDVKKYVNPESMASLKKLDETSEFAKGRDRYWNEKFKELEKEFKEIKASPDLKKAKAFQRKADAARKELQKDVDRINSATKAANNLRDHDLKDVVKIVGLGGKGEGGLSQKIFGESFRKKLETAYNSFKKYKTKLSSPKAEKKEEKKERIKGVTVEYPLYNPLPRFYLKKASFRTSAERRMGNWFSGLMTEVSSDPKMTGKPILLDMEGGSQDFPGAYFYVKGRADLTGETDSYIFNILGEGISSSMAENSLGKDSPVAIEGGTVGFMANIEIEGKGIKSGFLISMKDISMSAREEGLKGVDKSVIRILNESVKNTKEVNLKGEAKGTLEDLDVRITSNMDKILQEVVNQAVAQARVEVERRIREELDKELDKRLAGIKGLVTNRQTQIDSYKAEMRSRLDAEKKKLQDKAKAERKRQEEKLKKELEKKLKGKIKLPF